MLAPALADASGLLDEGLILAMLLCGWPFYGDQPVSMNDDSNLREPLV